MNSQLTILCVTDFSEHSMNAFKQACDIASSHTGSTIHLLTVRREVDAQFWNSYLAQADQDNTEQGHNDILRRIDEEYRPMLPADTLMHSHICTGLPAEKILQTAQELKANLLVISKQGTGTGSGLKRFFFGNFAVEVASQAKCPVLLIP